MLMVRDTEQKDSNWGRSGRRELLQLAGGVLMGGALLGSTSKVSGGPSPSTVIDLGDRGLDDGDVIDAYLDTYFQSGHEVRIPAGEYQWNGTGLSGQYANAVLIGDGDVVFRNQASNYVENVYAVDGGDVLLANITFRGRVDPGSSKCRLRFDARHSGSTVYLENVNLPDGAHPDSDAIGMFVGREHKGHVSIRNCHVESFPNNGIYTGAAAMEDGGNVHIDYCFVKDCNVDAIRIGAPGDRITNTIVIQDDIPPRRGVVTGRAIRIRYDGDDIVLRNVHITANTDFPIRVPDRGGLGSGHLKDIYIENNTNKHAIHIDGGTWTGETIHLTGDGSDTINGVDDVTAVYTGSDAEPPATSLAELDGSPEDPSPSYEHTLTIEGQGRNVQAYTFEVTGDLAHSKAMDATIDDEDEIDGRTATGTVANWRDSFAFTGDVVYFEGHNNLTLYLNGEEIGVSELGEENDRQVLTIEGSGNGAERYGLEVSGAVEQTEDMDATVDEEDVVDGNTATGRVNGGSDSFAYTGELTRFEYTGEPTVYIDGDKVDRDSLASPLPNLLVIDETSGSTSSYSFEVTGDVERSLLYVSDGDATINGGNVEGTVSGGHADAFRFSGDATSFRSNGGANILLEDVDG